MCFLMTLHGADIVVYQVETMPAVPGSGTGTSSCRSCSISNPASLYRPEKAAEGGQVLGLPAATGDTEKTPTS